MSHKEAKAHASASNEHVPGAPMHPWQRRTPRGLT